MPTKACALPRRCASWQSATVQPPCGTARGWYRESATCSTRSRAHPKKGTTPFFGRRGRPVVNEAPRPANDRTGFDEVLALLTPDRLLRDPRATGEGVALCVIDSGVERALLEQKHEARGQEIHPIEGAVFCTAQAEPLPYEGRQSTPHGTTVADIVLTL